VAAVLCIWVTCKLFMRSQMEWLLAAFASSVDLKVDQKCLPVGRLRLRCCVLYCKPKPTACLDRNSSYLYSLKFPDSLKTSKQASLSKLHQSSNYIFGGKAEHFRRCISATNIVTCGPGRVVGIVTAYGLDGPGIESRWGARFSAPVQTVPEAHPASCKMGTVSSPGVRCGRGVTLTPHPLLVPRSKIE
jgi:hypothetical protein